MFALFFSNFFFNIYVIKKLSNYKLHKGEFFLDIFGKLLDFWMKILTKLMIIYGSKTLRVPVGYHSRGRAGSGLSKIVGFGLGSI